MTEIITAIITGGLALAGVIVTNSHANRKFESKLETTQAVTTEKITELTREVREHNNFARRMPVVEEQIKSISRHVTELERTRLI